MRIFEVAVRPVNILGPWGEVVLELLALTVSVVVYPND